MTYNRRLFSTSVSMTRRKTFLLMALLLAGGMASAQVQINGNVYGGCNLGKVTKDTYVTMNGGTVGVIEYGRQQGTANIAPFDTIIHVNEAGRVFGGGMGNDTDPNTGRVEGNTFVTLTGGHVQYNVYGGGEMASVGKHTVVDGDFVPVENTGKATISVTGGQVGPTPRTDEGYNIPCSVFGLDGYVLGGGSGRGNDPDDAFKQFANVNSTDITVNMSLDDGTHANRIWGSVFGGGEDGHVLGNTKVVFTNGLMGPEGSVDYGGNIFGGGRNYYNNHVTCGRVRGNTEVHLDGGQIYGSLFGGGRSGVTGIGIDGDTIQDGGGNTYGHTSVTMSNDAIVGNLAIIDVSARTCGDVFGGGKGLPGSRLGEVKYANVTIEDDAQVLGNVYGGGEQAPVLRNTVVDVTDNALIGRKLTLAERKVTPDGQVTQMKIGNVYGGGSGNKRIDNNATIPEYHATAGRVYGNTEVTIEGNAVVRHAVYGGGNIASVGEFTVDNTTGVATYTEGGKTKVTISDNALIGPKKADLTEATDDELTAAASYFHMDPEEGELLRQYNDTAFRYLGCNEGWVFGSCRGLSGDELKHLAFVDTTEVIIKGNAQVVGNVFGGGENGHVQKGTSVLVQEDAVIGGIPLVGSGDYAYPYTVPSGAYVDAVIHGGVNELSEDECGVGPRIFRGNVFGGGKGNDFVSWLLPSVQQYSYTAGNVYGNASVSVESGTIYNKVYGGGTIASVGTFQHPNSGNTHAVTGIVQNGGKDTGHCYVTITGGQIGTNGRNNGEVYGGGRGVVGRPRVGSEPLQPIHQAIDLAYVGHTHVTVDGAAIKSTVYGGSANGHVQGNTKVLIEETTPSTTYIGTESHGAWHSNVYGGGGGTARYIKDGKEHFSITSGRVYGDTEVEITGGKVWHNVYGGGAIASVGTYDHTSTTQPYLGHGHAKVTITGGEIGSDGDENGMVFGSGRGEIAAPGHFLDSLIYVAYSEVNIGKEIQVPNNLEDPEGETHTEYRGDAKINGSVYGSGENGHVYLQAKVNIYSGTIGCTYGEFTAMGSMDDEKWEKFSHRGNVYGAGCGTDKYSYKIGSVDTTAYNPNSGYVQGNTEVNIYGGYISRNVYGGGAMASVGVINHKQTVKHLYANYPTQASLSWPYDLKFIEELPDENNQPVSSGSTVVNIFGGHIGTLAAPTKSGDVYGSCRGDVGPLGLYDSLAIVRTTQVNVNFSYDGTTIANNTPNCIVGSVYGSGENGSVYQSTNVTLTNGLIGGSVFGGGKGTDMYKAQLKNTNTDALYWTDVHSITAGKVYGSTEVEINGGNVLHNVYGGGNLASVGKGNYMGYGEMSTSANPEPYENSGTSTVKIYGGTVGTNGHINSYGNLNGFVYGSSKGITFVNVINTPRYEYSRDFFLGYSNKTNVTIGSLLGSGTGPTIHGSVFGGGENGHVRWHTNVTVNKGTIGAAYDADHASGADSLNYLVYRGNVYGAGRGIDPIDANANPLEYCNSAGSVTLNTSVTVNGGTIHHNVYGGGSMASSGPPSIPGSDYSPGTSLCTVTIKGGTIGEVVTPATGSPFNYGGDIFGAARGVINAQVNLARFATSSNTEVNIDSVALVIGDVYGGGEIGQTKQEALVNMKDGLVKGSVYGGGKGDTSDEMAALVLGHAIVDMDGGQVERSIYGGGELASVGTYNYTTVTYPADDPNGNANKPVQVPLSLKTTENGLANPELNGLTKVLVSGGTVGNYGSLMPWDDHNPDDDDRGWIFCGGQGVADSVTYYKAIALGVVGSTYLEISNTSDDVRPLITASVYGGAENGLVLGNTHVKIMGGQIGSGLQSKTTTNPIVGTFDGLYDEAKWQAAIDSINNGTINSALSEGHTLYNYFHECDAWNYAAPYKVYDIFADSTGLPNNTVGNIDYHTSALEGTNGHSFFGNVFGGGSGYYPFWDDVADTAVWRRTAGQVNGNTKVEIKGGHILTAVYGGNETTDVIGKCEVVMSGGTVGIPRTIAQIHERPVNGYVYGAGMGDPRNMMNSYNNVDSTNVQITGGTIFGSVFGGAKEGHVLDSTKVVVDGGLIGTTGFSGYDGHVFGGGKGKDVVEGISAVRQFPVGRVGGNTHVIINQADDDVPTKILGNVYGGGQVGLVGVDKDGWTDLYTTGSGYDSQNHGLSKVEVRGGTIGNSVRNGLDLLTSEQKSGNVYGAGRGNLNEFREDDLGRVGSSKVKISGTPHICGSVFGGGQMANAGYWIDYDHGYAEGTSVSEVFIQGTPVIGTALEFTNAQYANTKYDIINNLRMISHTRTGNVFGGGQGNVKLDGEQVVGLEHGHCGETKVNISGSPAIYGSVFGGSEEGAIWGDTKVTIEGGTIGKQAVGDVLDSDGNSTGTTKTYNFGSVFGGSYGADGYNITSSPTDAQMDDINGLAGRVYGNATVEIKDGTILGNVFGGGNMASVGSWKKIMDGSNLKDIEPAPYDENATNSHFNQIYGKTTVTVTGGTIGPLDNTGLNAYVFGGGKGFSNDPNEYRKVYANVNSTEVTISGGVIKGSVFGGGSDSHVLGNTTVEVHKIANIGTDGLSTYDGNVFGGGRNYLNSNHTNGRVRGNVNITMDGGAIQGSIFGGGRMALTGIDVNGLVTAFLDGQVYDSINHGMVTINITNDTVFDAEDPTLISRVYVPSIGNTNGLQLLNDSDESVGDVFGSGKGDTKNYADILSGRVAKTKINISGTPRIYGSVFGGGEMAGIGYWSDATGHPFYQGTGMSEVTIGRAGKTDNPEIGTNAEYTTEYANTDHNWTVYGTNGQYSPTGNTLIHTCTGNVFGGSQGDVNPEKRAWVSMARSRKTKVVVNGGTIKSCVYGGSEQGTVTTDTRVIINGGTIGSWVVPDESASLDPYFFGGVFGGGYGSHNPDYNASSLPNDSTKAANLIAGRVYGSTRVDVLNGTIQGDVYGGADYAYVNGNTLVNIGEHSTRTDVFTGEATFKGSVYGANNHAGTPFGNATVNVFSTAHTGQPDTTGGDDYPATPPTTPTQLAAIPHNTNNFAIHQVFGGGNAAHYTPNEHKEATVHVWQCDDNTVYEVYGGGNAADIGSATADYSTDSRVIIDGGRFHSVYGGGNGAVTASNIYGTANTTINAGLIDELFGGSNSQGLIDDINLQVNNSLTCPEIIGDIFSGGNEALVLGDVVTTVKCCDAVYGNFYGGTKLATIYGNVTVNIFGGTYNNLFAGSKGQLAHAAVGDPDDPDYQPAVPEKAADIRRFPATDAGIASLPLDHQAAVTAFLHNPDNSSYYNHGGNVTLNLFGGIINEAAFGGSDVNGNIDGEIRVNVYNIGSPICGLDLMNLYGAGRNTAYTPNFTPSSGTELISPVVNVINGTVKGNVFGGGQGSRATTTASPEVNIGYDASMGNLDDGLIALLNDTVDVHYHALTPTSLDFAAFVNGNVYGGGEEAEVEGNTVVNVNEGIIGTIVYTKSDPDGPFDGINHTGGNVFGGGKGSNYDYDDGRVHGNTNVNLKGGIIYNNLYGGGEMSSVGEREDADDVDDDYQPVEGTGTATVTINGGQVGPAPRVEMVGTDVYNIPVGINGSDGFVFGGGKGESNDYDGYEYKEFTDVNYTEVVIDVPDDPVTLTPTYCIWGGVFGGAEDGHVLGNTKVDLRHGIIGTTGEAFYDGNIFGGGRNYQGFAQENYSAGRVRGNSTVDMSGGRVLGNVYGGGSMGNIGTDISGEQIDYDDYDEHYGNVTVTISGGEVGTAVDNVYIGNVFGGSKGKVYDEESGEEIGDWYFWGNVNHTEVNIEDGTIHGSVYGGGEIGWVMNATEVNIEGGTIGGATGSGSSYRQYGSVYGGGKGFAGDENADGDPTTGQVCVSTEVNMSGGRVYENVYGGGELGRVGNRIGTTDTGGDTKVYFTGGQVGYLQLTGLNGNVYGGGRGVSNDVDEDYKDYANVMNTEVTIEVPEDADIDENRIWGNVFGGAADGHVLGNAVVKMKSGVIGTTALEGDGCIFGGGQGSGYTTGTAPNTVFHLVKHCGRVGGNTKVEMTDGTVMGSIYGGGQLALTGVDINGNPYLQTGNTVYDSISNHGLAVVEVRGGTIGIGGSDALGRELLESDYSIGDIFGSGQGDYDDPLAGRVANAKITVSGSPTIYCSVFGGGELAGVGYWRPVSGKQKFYEKSGYSWVTIGGTPKIGTALEFKPAYMDDPTDWTVMDTINNVARLFHTCSGNIFGGSQGDAAVTEHESWVSLGRSKNTFVHIKDNPEIMSSVFGGSEQGTVAGDTRVKIEGGYIGKEDLTSHIVTPNGSGGYTFTPGNIGTYSFGNVFGGGYGVDSVLIVNQSNDSINYPTANANPSLVANVIAGRVYGNTRLDITGGTIRGNVFGGGNMASVGRWTNVLSDPADPTTLIDFAPVANTGKATVNVGGTAIIGPMDGTGLNAYVFGGGKGIGNDPEYRRNAYCNVNSTLVTVDLTYAAIDHEADDPETLWNSVTDGRIYGSVYGGGSDCHVLGDTKVVIDGGLIGTYEPGTGTDPGTITAWGGNIFGGGRNFLKLNYGVGRVAGNTEIEMNDGVVYGTIFGGGRHAVTGTGLDGMTMRPDVGTTELHGQTTVKVKGGTVGYKPLVTSFLDRPIGEVYGGGKGSMVGTPGRPVSSALLIALVKNTNVEISQAKPAVPTYVLNTVYGGGEVGNVGHYTWTTSGDEISDITLLENTGKTNVTVKGGRIGMERMVMSYALKPGTFVPASNPVGNVFGGGKGLSDDPANYGAKDIDVIINGDHYTKYLLDLMATCGSTTVVVENQSNTVKPWVKGSVYGGSACGHVMFDTDVTIAGGQIGASDNGSSDQATPYDDGDFVDAYSVNLDDDANESNRMNPTYHWDYDPETLRPFDLVTIYNGQNSGAPVNDYKPTDGKTWYGNVFGGGSGFLPYVKKISTSPDVYQCEWNRESGKVYGNSNVTITGGHILSCVYGGCETADVGMYNYNTTIHGDEWLSGGTATVVMQGGTVGVPRTTTDIQNHPIPGYVYGSGKGDPRIYFNTWTNVNETDVTISSGKIFGSVFGSGEDGHVMGDVSLKVNNDVAATIIGSTGLSKADGNVFGGGRGTTPTALTAGSVSGNVNVSVSGDNDNVHVLGSVFGGGSLSSVGIYLVDKFLEDGTTLNTYYGKFHEDVTGDNPKTYGHVTVEVSGGRIGNNYETPTQVNPSSIGGHVFGGSRGLLEMNSSIWPSLARVKETDVTITGEADVKASVYGGGQIGIVCNDATVTVSGGSVGKHYGTEGESDHFHYGSVFGGGYGTTELTGITNDSTATGLYKLPMELAGRVYGNTYVTISGGQVWENVFGGGDMASIGMVKNNTMVKGATLVTVSGGQVGPLDMTALNGYVFGGGRGLPAYTYKDLGKVNSTHVIMNGSNPRVYGSLFGGGNDGHVIGDAVVDMDFDPTTGILGTTGETTWDGNIFGGGRNYQAAHKATGRVGGNVTVNVKRGRMLGSVFGGGRLGSVGVNDLDGDAFAMQAGDSHGLITVNIGGVDADGQTGNIIIGHIDSDTDCRVGGNVYGGGKGIAGASNTIYPQLAQARQSTVNVNEREGYETWIIGSVFGSAENGHVLENTFVNIHGGQIGGSEYGDYNPTLDIFHGNVYGGGRGLDTYAYTDPESGETSQVHSETAGKVFGNTFVSIDGGHIVRNVYGGGNVASVGRMVTVDEEEVPVDGTGLATVSITGGTVGANNEGANYGNVFGSSHGGVGGDFIHLAYVNNTHVTVGGEAKIYGSVFGGGEDGHVKEHTRVDMQGGTVGDEDDDNFLNGNVYGGGRGLYNTDSYVSPTAGEVFGHTTVNVKRDGSYTPVIYRNVYGGGSSSAVHEYKMVNMSDGHVYGSVFGGSRQLPSERENKSQRWVNMWGGTIEGDLYGCSYNCSDGDATKPLDWVSFVNMSGGTVKGNVYGAGNRGEVNGSVAVLIGKHAITGTASLLPNTHKQETPVAAALDIKGSVFGGSNFFGSSEGATWREFDVTGYSKIYIDGNDYNTSSSSDNFMIIRGGLFGSGTNCESGREGRDIVLRNYGDRNMIPTYDTLNSVSRTLTTIQRVGNLVLDNANIALTGARDLSDLDGLPDTYYGIYQVDTSFMVCNGSSIVLGDAIIPADIDSVKVVRSVRLDDDVYDKFFLPELAYTWIGVKDESTDVNLYYYNSNPEATPVALTRAQENVILFQGRSKLFVRYHIFNTVTGEDENQYGELQGFFRMSSPFKPYDVESFAYARQKKPAPNPPDPSKVDELNYDDGGFVSYHAPYNFYTDYGHNYTQSNQYPYVNVVFDMNPDLFDCRGWYIPSYLGNPYYVDGTGTWGRNLLATEGWGRYPDRPKLTIVGGDDPDDDTHRSIMGDHTLGDDHDFNPAEDIIYVVGAISGAKELEFNDPGLLNTVRSAQLRIYRYPGGHLMYGDKYYDGGPGAETTATVKPGPGANYGPLLVLDDDMDASKTLTLENVLLDGLHGVSHNPEEIQHHQINTHATTFNEEGSKSPLVVVKNGTLLLKGEKTLDSSDEIVTNGTILQRGYNKIDASTITITQDAVDYTFDNFYTDPDFTGTVTVTTEGETPTSTPYSVINGAGLYVVPGSKANVQVEGLVTIAGNKQKKGSGTIDCNVYLPTFDKHIEISDRLATGTEIGVTSPIRNTMPSYLSNTFSPVAEGISPTDGSDLAKDAWMSNYFRDDQDWFFTNATDDGMSKTTYYDDGNNTLFFGWTWANVVRKQPVGYNDASGITISTKEGLAWLLSKTMGLNGQTPANDFDGTTVTQTGDFDMTQYVWVPIGSSDKPFRGTYQGNGHTISNLIVRYIGTGDRKYELSDYGLFGYVDNGTINRTFVVSGLMKPVGLANIGGLVGTLNGKDAVLSNSEAAVEVECPDNDNNASYFTGGLVGQLIGGDVHSSMAMPNITFDAYTSVGGLVGATFHSSDESHRTPTIKNSFANVNFGIGHSDCGAGGLVGYSASLAMANCYSYINETSTLNEADTYAQLVARGNSSTALDYCFGQAGNIALVNNNAIVMEHCNTFSAVTDVDRIGYMYSDNLIEDDTTLVGRLNLNAMRLNKAAGDSIYAHWARPAMAGLNGDLPVLLLSEFDRTTDLVNNDYQGSFRSVSTYAGGPALQYGGPLRDGTANELDEAIERLTFTDKMFVYGDIVNEVAEVPVSGAKMSISEHAAIVSPGALAGFGETYVGITFENSSRKATDAYGTVLNRDWHMLSSPLQAAPLGVNYGGDNDEYGFQTYPSPYPFFLADAYDGYFPSNARLENGSSGTADYFCWYEPDWQWINFKRNGNSHWHYDPYNDHGKIEYHYDNDKTNDETKFKNETNLVQGKGYMMAIQEDTYMQSHGALTKDEVSIFAPAQAKDYGTQYKGNNLIGNPYHAYLDFTQLVNENQAGGVPYFNSYYVYDADRNGYVTYPQRGSRGGDYAPRYLHPHQGFFVQSPNTVTIDFDASMTVARNVIDDLDNSDFRDDDLAYPLVNLYAEDAIGRTEILVVEFDRPENGGGYKSKALLNGNHQMYAHCDDHDYSAFFAVEGTERVPVWFKSLEANPTTYKLHWNTQNGNFHSLYLVDNLTGVTYDMLRNDSYSFVASKEDYLSRFYITFKVTGVDEHETPNGFAFYDGSQWVINGRGYLDFIDETGRILHTERLSGDQSSLDFSRFAKGVYMLRLRNSATVKTQKIVL